MLSLSVKGFCAWRIRVSEGLEKGFCQSEEVPERGLRGAPPGLDAATAGAQGKNWITPEKAQESVDRYR